MSVWILTVADPEKGGMKDVTAGQRFTRLCEDIDSITSYMYDIRICFIALTILIYCVLIGYVVHVCFWRKRRIGGNQRRARPQWDFQGETNQTSDYRNQTGAIEDLVSVRSDGQVGTGLAANTTANPPTGLGQPAAYMGRNHRSAAPFMRHGRHMDHQFGRGTGQNTGGTTSLSGPNATTRLMTSDADGTVVKHQIPHITTSEVPYEQTNGPSSITNNEDDSKNGNNNTGTAAHGMPMRSLHHRQMNHHHQTIINDTTEM